MHEQVHSGANVNTTMPTETTMDEETAALILIQGMTMKIMEQAGIQPFVAASLAIRLKEHGFTPVAAVRVLQGAFRQLEKVGDALEFLKLATMPQEQGKES